MFFKYLGQKLNTIFLPGTFACHWQIPRVVEQENQVTKIMRLCTGGSAVLFRITIALIDASEGSRTVRGLTPASWFNANESYLVDIFGQSHFGALRKAASDPRTSFKVDPIDS
ncbi:hypothetical protein BDZ97DRAFT_264254 [Flammula alnicola]|nr:hypothetical protein BDZ97DRAFT_264254 [Flammula alnicola]